MQGRFELDGAVLKSDGALTLHRSDRVSVEIGGGTLALAVKRDGERCGYVFCGDGKLLLDSIVETEEGAFGKPVRRVLKEPFLMLGDTMEVARHLSSAGSDDTGKWGLDEKTVLGRAQELLGRFSRLSRVSESGRGLGDRGWVFAFSSGGDKLDTLVLTGSKLVYAAGGMSFVCDGDKCVLSSSGHVVLSHHGKSVVIDAPHQSHGCCFSCG